MQKANFLAAGVAAGVVLLLLLPLPASLASLEVASFGFADSGSCQYSTDCQTAHDKPAAASAAAEATATATRRQQQ